MMIRRQVLRLSLSLDADEVSNECKTVLDEVWREKYSLIYNVFVSAKNI
jgi:hypothetical protein